MNRRGIREQVFKLLFRAEFNTPDQMEEQARFFFDSGDFKATEADEKTIIEKTRKIMEKIPELDQMIGSGLKEDALAELFWKTMKRNPVILPIILGIDGQ